MKTRLQPSMLALAVISLVLGSVTYTLAGQYTSNAAQIETVGVGMPFTGKWAYNAPVKPPYTDRNSSHPSVHWAPGGGDWATDLYAASGTAVHLKLINPSGSLSYTWLPSSTSCGKSTRLAVKVDGISVGSIYMAHLANAVKSGPITNGMKLGTVAGLSCNPGHHVHVEYKNSSGTGKSCYRNLTVGNKYMTGTWLGNLGKPGVATVKTACPAGTTPGDGGGGTGKKADLIVHDAANATWAVAESTGNSFAGLGIGLSSWGKGDWSGLADVTGDGKADIVTHNPANNTFAVAKSDAAGRFIGLGSWLSGWGAGDWAGLGDVTGDGKADLVVVSADTHNWAVARSTGTSFEGLGILLYGWGMGDWRGLADVTGDGKADIVTHEPNGTFGVAKSNGNSFSSAGTWLSGWGAGDWAGLGDVK